MLENSSNSDCLSVFPTLCSERDNAIQTQELPSCSSFASGQFALSPISFSSTRSSESNVATRSRPSPISDTTSDRPSPVSEVVSDRPSPISTEPSTSPTDSNQTQPVVSAPSEPTTPHEPTLGITINTSTSIPIPIPAPLPPITQEPTVSPSLQFSQLTFDGKEGSSGTVQIQLQGLAQAPTTPLTLTLTAGDFLVVDADNNLQNGTQNTLTFTATDWNQPRTIWLIAEKDGVATDRLTGNAITYSLEGTTSLAGSYDLGTVTNTYAPDLTKFDIDLDFRNDTTGFWTEARRAIAQKAADDWSNRIANEWTGLQLNTTFSKVGADGNYSTQTFATKRYVDDLLVFVNTITSSGAAGGFGGIEYSVGGWLTSPELAPRVGQIAIDPTIGDSFLYNAVLHELGHTLGLVGLNWGGFLQQNLATPQTAVFTGLYSTAVNGGNFIPLQSQDEVNPVTGAYDYWHPASSIYSVMSYGSIYSVTGPTAIDFAMLADSGYSVYGVNVPFPITPTIVTSTPVTSVATTAPVTVAA